jgi:hypothetical protein
MAIEQRDAHRFMPKDPGGRESAEAAPDDHDM